MSSMVEELAPPIADKKLAEHTQNLFAFLKAREELNEPFTYSDIRRVFPYSRTKIYVWTKKYWSWFLQKYDPSSKPHQFICKGLSKYPEFHFVMAHQPGQVRFYYHFYLAFLHYEFERGTLKNIPKFLIFDSATNNISISTEPSSDDFGIEDYTTPLDEIQDSPATDPFIDNDEGYIEEPQNETQDPSISDPLINTDIVNTKHHDVSNPDSSKIDIINLVEPTTQPSVHIAQPLEKEQPSSKNTSMDDATTPKTNEMEINERAKIPELKNTPNKKLRWVLVLLLLISLFALILWRILNR